MPKSDPIFNVLINLFCVVVIVSNFIAAKLIIFGNATLSAGMLIYPITFLISDLVTEIYGREKARMMICLGFFMSLVACGLVYLAILLPPYEQQMQSAFLEVFGKSPIFIFASLTAYVLAQLLDVNLYSYIRKATDGKYLWLRSNGSTLISQALDTFLVTYITFGWAFGLNWETIKDIIFYSYLYKAAFIVILTPIYYLAVHLMRRVVQA